MSSQGIRIDFDQRKKKFNEEKKEKKFKGWVKTTKFIQQKVETAFLGFFRQKKVKSPVIRSSEVIEKCKSGGLEELRYKKGFTESSGETQTTLSNLLKQIPETNDLVESRERKKQENLTRISSWGVSTKPKLKIARSMRKRGNVRVGEESKEFEAVDQNSRKRDEEEEEEEEEEEMELCKKRILMGGKCKPLEFSGVLHNRKKGMFSPGR